MKFPFLLIFRKTALKKILVLLVNHKLFEFFIIILTMIYCLIVFLTLFVQDKNMTGTFTDSEYNLIVYVCQIIEMVILIFFITEIFIKIYAFGFVVEYFLIFYNFVHFCNFLNFCKIFEILIEKEIFL